MKKCLRYNFINRFDFALAFWEYSKILTRNLCHTLCSSRVIDLAKVYFLSNCSRSSRLIFEAKSSISMFIILHTCRHDAKVFMSRFLRIFLPICERPGFVKNISMTCYQAKLIPKDIHYPKETVLILVHPFSVVSL